jgi:DNA-binding HxlR family transcriptional regulator
MATSRSYGEACAAAHALDLVGERWALLVVRELLLGPKRFTDLREGLPHASPNVMAQRLRDLETHGIVQRRKLGPPARTWVYELSEWGRELEPVILALGRWGARSPFRPDGVIGVDSMVMGLKAIFDPTAAGDLHATYELRFGDDRFSIGVDDGTIDVARAEASGPDAVIDTDPKTFAAVVSRSWRLDDAIGRGRLKVTGQKRLVSRLLDALRMPEPAPVA